MYDGIDTVAVVGQKDKAGDEDVVAFVQLEEGQEVIPEKVLKSYLKKHLANYKIPKHIYTVEELPKNATGKVLKRVLKEELEKGELLEPDVVLHKKEEKATSASDETVVDIEDKIDEVVGVVKDKQEKQE